MTTIFSTVLIIAIAISVSLLVILVNNFYTQKRSNKLLSAFNDAAADFNLSITKMDLLGSRMIGLDEEKNKMLFLAQTKKKYDGYLVDLNEIKMFAVKKEYARSGAVFIKGLGVEALLEKIELKLEYKNSTTFLSLPFYEKAKDPIYEIQERSEQAKGWQSLLTRVSKNDWYFANNDQKASQKRGVMYQGEEMLAI
jgi:hypothetical protein